MAIGAAIMAAWVVRPMELAQSVPLLFAMQFNTAACFVLSGAAFNLRLSGYHKAALLPALLAGAMGVATLIQYLNGTDLHIDRMIVDPFVTNGASVPGRMAPNTAICFFLVNLALILPEEKGIAAHARVLMCVIVFVVAATAFVGYILGISSAHDWIRFARMSPHTAFSFLILSAGIVYSGSRRLGYNRSTISATLAACSYLLLVVLTYLELLRDGSSLGLSSETALMQARTTLLSILLASGIVFLCLIVYAFRTASRYQEMAEKLAESETRLSATISTAADGFMTFGQDGRIKTANPACRIIFGYHPEELLGRSINTLISLPGEVPPQSLSLAGRLGIMGGGPDLEGRHRNGTRFSLDLSVAELKLGDAIIYNAIVRDISERKRYEREILDANAELTELSYRTSHDLRSPIASSLGLLGILRDMTVNGAPTHEVEPVVTRIEASFRKLDHLIQNIILLTRTKVMDEQETPISVAKTVREAMEGLRHLDGEGRTRIRVDIPETLVIYKKASRFQIIVENLLSNAIKYSDPAEPNPEIDIGAKLKAGEFVLTVADNGLGIASEAEPELFRMFKRLHPQHAFGSGLGLYILRKSAEHLGGTVTFRRRDKGSLFTVTLPEAEPS